MRQTSLPVRELASKWKQDPEFRKAYDALEDEFALARALITARAEAELTQEQLANAMGTTQAAIARLESGRAKPSTRTLQRFAEATGTKLTIRFERIPGHKAMDVHT